MVTHENRILPFQPIHTMPYSEYQVIGRKLPTEKDPSPKIYRMRIFSKNEVIAKSRFWYYLSQLYKLKKSNGEVLSVNEIHDKSPKRIKNFGVFLRYNSRSGTHNMYKEFRDLTRVGAINQLYNDMAARHRAREKSIQIIQIEEIPASKCRRASTKQFHTDKIHFPNPHRVRKVVKRDRVVFARTRPTTYRL
eukprot:TRINITY_DN413_c0_g1_i1.p1 TRINITY_DN413_c0_g1~~TRINITY_DN413_c0_g1_i1.p1  ORF type:complete len:192 (+),score=37.62 TRINITY_DN413_c0_g1_i1:1-576(+)